MPPRHPAAALPDACGCSGAEPLTPASPYPVEAFAVELAGAEYIPLAGPDGRLVEVIVHSLEPDPADPAGVIINYRTAAGVPGAVCTGAREKVRYRPV